ncbi:MAG: hypothetical protein IT376_03480 [Polyangiaceae bacterium]|nr:hypothetical protein [Polyangiaceae bacterium]
MERHTTLRQRCVVCGGPRVTLDDTRVERTGREEPALEEARRLDFQFAAWRLGAIVAAGSATIAALLGGAVLAIASPALVPTLLTLAVLGAPWLFVAWAAYVAAQRAKARERALDGAWESVASDVATELGELSPVELASALRLDQHEADALVARLGAVEGVLTRLGADGDVVLQSLEPRKLRVATGAATQERGPREADEGSEGEEPARATADRQRR